MKKKICVLTFEIDAETDLIEASTVVRDALAEFIGHRAEGDAKAYVDKRYQGNPSLCTATKVAEVTRRLDIARALRATLFFGRLVNGEIKGP